MRKIVDQIQGENNRGRGFVFHDAARDQVGYPPFATVLNDIF